MYLIFSRKGWFKESLFGSWIHFWVVSYSEGSDRLNKYRYHICHDCKYVSSFTSSLTHPSIHSFIHTAIHSSIYPSIFFYLSIHPVTKPSLPSIYPFSLSFIHILFYWLFCFILVHFLYFFPFSSGIYAYHESSFPWLWSKWSNVCMTNNLSFLTVFRRRLPLGLLKHQSPPRRVFLKTTLAWTHILIVYA